MKIVFCIQIFSIAISGNIANYLQEANTNFHWRYNFHLVSIAATTIVLYVILIPFALWAAFKWTARPVDSDLITDDVSVLAVVTIALSFGLNNFLTSIFMFS